MSIFHIPVTCWEVSNRFNNRSNDKKGILANVYSNRRQLIESRTPEILVEDLVRITREVEEDHQLLEPPQVLLAGAAASPGAALAAAQSLVSV